MNMEVRFTSRTELAPDVYEYSFESNLPMDFIAGQYAKFWFANDTSLGGRTFTLTSRPGDTVASFIVRFPHPMSAYKQMLLSIPEGTVMRYEQPMGDAILPRDTSTPLVFIAQGIGIASYIAILRECKDKALSFAITVFWTHRKSDRQLEQSFKSYLTDHTSVQEYDSSARLSLTDIMPMVRENTLLYISGSQNFVESIGAQLEHSGVLRERIVYDYYEGYQDL